MFPSFYQQQHQQKQQRDLEGSQYMLRLQYLRNEQLKNGQHIQQQHYQYFRPQFQPNMQRSQSFQSNFNDSNSSQNVNRPSRAEFTYYAHQANVKQTRISNNQQRVQKPVSNVICPPKEIKWPEKGSKLAITGNIFEPRNNWDFLSQIPIAKQNSTHIRLEDEGPYGNDDTRCFILSYLSSKNIKSIPCVFCEADCTVYDRFPLLNGTMFTSPTSYGAKKSILVSMAANKEQYINAVCLKCMSQSNRVTCNFCSKPWTNGSFIQIGTLYKYDVVACMPCCPMRVSCKGCLKPMVDLKHGGLQSFSQYSEIRDCSNCSRRDFHFCKSVDETFTVKK